MAVGTLGNFNYRIPDYINRLCLPSVKKNRNDSLMVFITEKFNLEIYEYDHSEANIIKLKLRVDK